MAGQCLSTLLIGFINSALVSSIYVAVLFFFHLEELVVLTFTDNLKFAKRHLPNPPAVDVLSDTVVIVAHNNPCRDSFSSLAECKREHRKRLSATVWRLHNKTRQECLSSR